MTGKSRVFFPQAALDQWLSSGRIDLSGSELVIASEGRRYRIVEAVRVLRVVNETPDIYEITGRVKTLAHLLELGAELLGDSLLIGDIAYQVIPGFWGTPIGSFEEHRSSATAATGPGSVRKSPEPESDEELLAQFLIQNLD
jgi:hypothetical protein